MQSLVAPMTSKESSKKVPFYYYTASAFPNSKHGFGLVNHCMHIFHRQARNQVSLFGCEIQTGRGWNWQLGWCTPCLVQKTEAQFSTKTMLHLSGFVLWWVLWWKTATVSNTRGVRTTIWGYISSISSRWQLQAGHLWAYGRAVTVSIHGVDCCAATSHKGRKEEQKELKKKDTQIFLCICTHTSSCLLQKLGSVVFLDL
jgi:hypothetical protein